MNIRISLLAVSLLALPLALSGCDAAGVDASAEAVTANATGTIQGPALLCPWSFYDYTGSDFLRWGIKNLTGAAIFRSPYGSTDDPTAVEGTSPGTVQLRVYTDSGVTVTRVVTYNPDC